MDHLHDANLLERALVDKANQSRVPITTNFELTPTCTLNCDMCFIRTERSVVERHGGLSPLQQWLDWAEQLQDMGTLSSFSPEVNRCSIHTSRSCTPGCAKWDSS